MTATVTGNHVEAPASDSPNAAPPLSTPWALTDRPVPTRVVQPLQRFLHTQVAGGAVLLLAALAAIAWVNSPFGDSYHRLWEAEAGFELGGFGLHMHLGHWINDLAMAVFFFVVGLEIKRELVHGDLRDPKAIVLPVVAALGGMVVPAVLYMLLNVGGAGLSGWGVPMATDIAFAVGVLALVGRRAPAGLKIFLLTLAIADDIGAIIVIALFYSTGMQFGWLVTAGGAVVAVVVLGRLGVRSLAPYVLLAAFLWYAMLSSGVHATIAGVILGLLTPAIPFHRTDAVAQAVGARMRDVLLSPGRGDRELDEQRMLDATRMANEGVSPLARLEAKLHVWSAFVILPLFALANAGVELSGSDLRGAATDPIALGVVLGLVIGKPLGVFLAARLAVATGAARLPDGITWRHMVGAGMLGGIGFTVALFITNLAFIDPSAVDAAKVGILVASTVSGIGGFLFLSRGAGASREAAA